jgi:glycosyltransferase involved in cell wall biosynthesis
MKVLILGGSPNHSGGVETFGDRAEAALNAHAPAVHVERLWTHTAYFRLHRLKAVLNGLMELGRARDKRESVVWLQYVNLPDLLYLITAKLAGFRVMVTPHLGSNWASQRNPLLRLLSRAALTWSDRIALIAPTQASEIALPTGTPRSLIRTFLPLDVFDARKTPPPLDNELRIVHASRLSEAKGSFLVVDVCRALRDAGVRFVAEIVGSADEMTVNRLKSMIATAGLANQVTLVGSVPPTEVIERLCRANLLIHLSKTDSYPLIVLEALACGAFPIALDLPGVASMVSDYGGWIVPATSAVEDASRIVQTIDLPTHRSRGAVAAEAVRAHFNWDDTAALLLDALAVTACDTKAALNGNVRLGRKSPTTYTRTPGSNINRPPRQQ